MSSESHLRFLRDFFRLDVYVVTEYRGDAVYSTKKIGEVAAFSDKPPFRVGAAMLVSHTPPITNPGAAE